MTQPQQPERLLVAAIFKLLLTDRGIVVTDPITNDIFFICKEFVGGEDIINAYNRTDVVSFKIDWNYSGIQQIIR